MNTTIKRFAAVGSMFALVAVSGCSSLDVTVAYDDEGYAMPGSATDDITKQMHADSQTGGE